eukprot:591875-Pyramimonas_sp.AAC.1
MFRLFLDIPPVERDRPDLRQGQRGRGASCPSTRGHHDGGDGGCGNGFATTASANCTAAAANTP